MRRGEEDDLAPKVDDDEKVEPELGDADNLFVDSNPVPNPERVGDEDHDERAEHRRGGRAEDERERQQRRRRHQPETRDVHPEDAERDEQRHRPEHDGDEHAHVVHQVAGVAERLPERLALEVHLTHRRGDVRLGQRANAGIRAAYEQKRLLHLIRLDEIRHRVRGDERLPRATKVMEHHRRRRVRLLFHRRRVPVQRARVMKRTARFFGAFLARVEGRAAPAPPGGGSHLLRRSMLRLSSSLERADPPRGDAERE